jgi:hypothetical protein
MFAKSWLKYGISALALSLAVSGIGAISSPPAAACDGDWDVACNVGDTFEQGAHDAGNAIEQGAHDAGNAIEQGAHDTGRAIEQGAHDTGRAIEQGAHDTGRAIEQGAHDTGRAIEQAAHDYGKAAEKAMQDLGTAAETIGQFVDHQWKGVGQTLSDAEKRAREGKIVDAVWGLSTDSWKHTEENAATAVQRSNILNAAAQYAASAYGGPAGSAAYAAWYTYRATGNIDTALRAGIVSGVSSSISAAGKLPDNTSAQIAEKVVVTSVLAGGAAALNGEDPTKAMTDAAIQAGVTSAAAGIVGNLPPAQKAAVTRAMGGAAVALARGDVQALKNSAVQAGMARVGEKLPTEGLTRKALVNGALGGLAIAASGGNEKAIAEGFLRSGGMVLVQKYEKAAGDRINRLTQGKAFCMDSKTIDCSRPLSALPDYVRQNAAWPAEKLASEVKGISDKKTFALNGSIFVKWDMGALAHPEQGIPAVVLSIPSPVETPVASQEANSDVRAELVSQPPVINKPPAKRESRPARRVSYDTGPYFDWSRSGPGMRYSIQPPQRRAVFIDPLWWMQWVQPPS